MPIGIWYPEGTEKNSDGLYKCCANRANRKHVDVSPDGATQEICTYKDVHGRVCGRRHFEIELDPGLYDMKEGKIGMRLLKDPI